MRLGRALVVVAVVGSIAGVTAVGRERPAAQSPSFTALGRPTLPFVPPGPFITSSWYCPGVPVGHLGESGQVVVTNPSDQQVTGQLTVFTSAEQTPAVATPITLGPRATVTFELSDYQKAGDYLSALVELGGGAGTFVEQRAVHPKGASVSPCANATSSTWYFADGSTEANTTEQIVLTNPSADTATVDISFVTTAGPRSPPRLQGYPVPGHSVAVVELGARDEPLLAAKVVATHGRVVAARSQAYDGGGRSGYSMTLGAPSLEDQYYFADGEKADGVTEQFRIYNPTDQDVTVDLVYLGVAVATDFSNDQSIDVPAGNVVSFDSKDAAGLPAGRHGAVFSTLAGASVVVERIITRTTAGTTATSVVMGQPGSLASRSWSAGIGSDVAIDDAIVVLNVDNVATTVTVSTLGPGGLVPVAGLEQVPLPAGGLITLPLRDASSLGKAFVVRAGQRLFVERLLPRGAELRGRSGSFALADLT